MIIASVVPPIKAAWRNLSMNLFSFEPMQVSRHLDTGLKIMIDNPAEAGADRIVNSVAAFDKYAQALIIVDFGTATTFEAITAAGEYLGGAIAPGVGVAADALAQRAARLPVVDIAQPPSPIGRNTVHSIQSGLFYGYVGLVEGMVARFKAELKTDAQVIGTGGLAPLFASATDVLDVIAPWLTLDGLRILYEMNRGEASEG